GVIQFIRKKSPGLSVDVSAGSEATSTASAFLGGKYFTASADFFSTVGFVLVRPGERGLVDVAADSRHTTLDLTARRESAFVGGAWWSDHSQLNPRLSLLWRSFSASAYTAFRAPTLNELYRGFRVGNINTLPNASLDAENMTGFEIGKRTNNARVTMFWTSISNTIA